MSDEEFIEQFETCALPAEDFHHREHVRIAWLYLQKYNLLDVLARLSENLKNFAKAHGKPNLYHETITFAYVFLIYERIRRNEESQTWKEFAATNTDLLAWQDGVLAKYYRAETLASDFARNVFVLPDKIHFNESY